MGTIEIDAANPYFKTDEESVIYTNDGKELIYYPIARDEKQYIIPETVKVIKKESFTESKLDSVVFPLHLKTIEEKLHSLKFMKQKINKGNIISKNHENNFGR